MGNQNTVSKEEGEEEIMNNFKKGRKNSKIEKEEKKEETNKQEKIFNYNINDYSKKEKEEKEEIQNNIIMKENKEKKEKKENYQNNIQKLIKVDIEKNQNINSKKKIELYENINQREVFEYLGDLYSIFVSVEHLEKQYIRDVISTES
jgi:hypothetical protein